jgi:hypothetical protein
LSTHKGERFGSRGGHDKGFVERPEYRGGGGDETITEREQIKMRSIAEIVVGTGVFKHLFALRQLEHAEGVNSFRGVNAPPAHCFRKLSPSAISQHLMYQLTSNSISTIPVMIAVDVCGIQVIAA